MHHGRNLRIFGLVNLDGSDTALPPGRRARTRICNKAAASPAASSLSSGSHRFIVGGWSVCLTQSAGRYLESGCRAGWQTRDEGDFRCNNLVHGQSSGWLATRYGAVCCATTEMQPILCCSSAGVRGAGGLGRLGKDVVGQQHLRAPSDAAHWLPWGASFDQLVLSCWDAVGWSGLVQPYTPPPLGLERSNDPPPAPSQVPSPGKRTRVQRDRLVSIWRTQQRRGVSPAIGRVARVAVFQIGGAAVPEIRRATRGMYVFSPLGFPQVLASPETGIAPWLSLEI
ncbi:hypothetical protein TRIATDRAFT_305990 [Trichoderma atroviride IMI 206040]|uniref:Uncharacterized protein n=1 Tax=Hypocrea atroviridis (strain ATCC 20476 / IMI 206040) TaxID=452589 RepID=G9NMX5_HYPAI|nr:uncharacterized protein TRIATDRAFT_305990 [Trichoderma atroviride IMI 206040]EHK48255.1 hypothetical protein TRIATDRAFT_305990 [Trichoderma atroviride IMI 206040]